jgi:uncharacterized sporulation protein YeaH/YhbH (DUF444 family)
MAHFVDRRLNPKEKSLGNRRRFIRRVRAHVKHAVDESVRRRGIADVDRGGGHVSVPADGVREPTFHHASQGGVREHVLPGNKSFRAGDRIDRPPSGGGGRGRRAAPDGEAEDDFAFVLSRDEFLEIFFEDLELPDMVKRTLRETKTSKPRRAGHSVTGSPANLNVPRSMRNALGRRLALRRPSDRQVLELQARIFELEALHEPGPEERAELAALHEALEQVLRRQKRIPYLDPLDVRYNYFEQRPEPNARAVMFCLMDVSASMGEREKDLAKRFFVLLHLFLSRRYDSVDLVFIRHTDRASEVDEETFFHSRESGGTIVSTALAEMRRVIAERYAPSEWNIYAAQASDGDNYGGDSPGCAGLLNDELLKLCQHFAYVEIIREEEAQFLKSDGSGTELWIAYRGVAERWRNFAMKRIARAADIYPVFRELFGRKAESEQA